MPNWCSSHFCLLPRLTDPNKQTVPLSLRHSCSLSMKSESLFLRSHWLSWQSQSPLSTQYSAQSWDHRHHAWLLYLSSGVRMQIFMPGRGFPDWLFPYVCDSHSPTWDGLLKDSHLFRLDLATGEKNSSSWRMPRALGPGWNCLALVRCRLESQRYCNPSLQWVFEIVPLSGPLSPTLW